MHCLNRRDGRTFERIRLPRYALVLQIPQSLRFDDLSGYDGMVGIPLILAPHNEPLYPRTVQVSVPRVRDGIDLDDQPQ